MKLYNKSEQIEHFKHLTDAICSVSNVTFIYMSHYQEQVPDCITHILEFKAGQVVHY